MHRSEVEVLPVEGLPEEAVWDLIEDEDRQRGENHQADKELRAAARRLREESWGRLRSLIGKEHLAAYAKLQEERIQRMRSIRTEIARSGRGVQQLEEERLRQVRATAEFADRAGVSENSVRAIQKELAEGYAALVHSRTDGAPQPPVPGPRSTKCTELVLKPPYFYCGSDARVPVNVGGLETPRCRTTGDALTGYARLESQIRARDAGKEGPGLTLAVNQVRFHWCEFLFSQHRWLTLRAVFEDLSSSAHGSAAAQTGWGFYELQNKVRAEFRLSLIVAGSPWSRRWSSPSKLIGEDGGQGFFECYGTEGVDTWEVDFWRPDKPAWRGAEVRTEDVTFEGPFHPPPLGILDTGIWLGSLKVELHASNYVGFDGYEVDSSLCYELRLKSIHATYHE